MIRSGGGEYIRDTSGVAWQGGESGCKKLEGADREREKGRTE